jgi:hypothetical protein
MLLQKHFSKTFERWLKGDLEVKRLALYWRCVGKLDGGFP